MFYTDDDTEYDKVCQYNLSTAIDALNCSCDGDLDYQTKSALTRTPGAVTGMEVDYSTILVGMGKIWVEPNSFIVITNPLVEVAMVGIGVAAIYSRREHKLWVELDPLIVIINRRCL